MPFSFILANRPCLHSNVCLCMSGPAMNIIGKEPDILKHIFAANL
ncbi:hypothetical protein IHE45_08G089600 [Dioscorea alata]|uniref:Uncharacterized protein n=1 Tax=Dioscorea alata TaxID=55571 RepID=A0ACB7VKQ9_DIOAL|nr:hypothetical protein IHE45_08G089600 [Dioscorea alata]